MTKSQCVHNAGTHYTSGFKCDDCGVFLRSDSPRYIASWGLNSILLVMHNINVDRSCAGLTIDPDVAALEADIDVGSLHGERSNWKELYERALILMLRHNVNQNSATLELR